METFYPAITEDQWEEIVSADKSHDYQLHPTKTSPRHNPPSDSSSDLPSNTSNPEGTSLPADASPAAYLFGD